MKNANTLRRIVYVMGVAILVLVGAFAILAFSYAKPGAARADGSANVTFTKWVTSVGTGPAKFNMEGVVSGDVGGGRYTGEVINLANAAGITNIDALYHINGGAHQFTANLHVTQDDNAGTATIKGFVTDGWLKGSAVQGEYHVIAKCGILNAQPGPFGDTCFSGTLQVLPGASQ